MLEIVEIYRGVKILKQSYVKNYYHVEIKPGVYRDYRSLSQAKRNIDFYVQYGYFANLA